MGRHDPAFLRRALGRWPGRLVAVLVLSSLIALMLAAIGYGGAGTAGNFIYSYAVGLGLLAAVEAAMRCVPERQRGWGLPLATLGGMLAGVAVATGILQAAGLGAISARELAETLVLSFVLGLLVTGLVGFGAWLAFRDEILEREQAALAELRAAQARIGESLAYAERLQRAALPAAEPAALGLSDLAVWWQPRDEVGGDVYCFARRGDRTALLLMDGTGHGVPGALIGFVALDVGERLLSQASDWDPAALLAGLDERMRQRLHREGGARRGDDGLEAGLAVCDRARGEVRYAGVGLHLVAVGPDGAETYRGARGGVGYRDTALPGRIGVHTVPSADTLFWLATDGLLEQPGGEKGLQLGRKGVARLVEAASAAGALGDAMADLQARFAAHQDGYARRDDATVLAFRA